MSTRYIYTNQIKDSDTKKSYLENVNGLQNFEEFNINYDSSRDKNKQVKATKIAILDGVPYIEGSNKMSLAVRSNSDYNIIVQDYNNDIYLHQDYTVRDSIHTILCLQSNMYTIGATSYKHNGPVPSLFPDIADMRWTEIHGKYQTVSVNFGGVFAESSVQPSVQPDVSIDIYNDNCILLRNGRRVHR